MKCPNCGFEEDKVLESRPSADKTSIRRRRECLSCGTRFTSYERTEESPIMVIKRDGRREPFNREKIHNGIYRACEKRPVSIDAIEDLIDGVEKALRSVNAREIESKEIGKLVMERLQRTDQIAYVRFASVYRQFKDVSDFVKEVRELSSVR
jgi:transcriptional repressor NrdR